VGWSVLEFIFHLFQRLLELVDPSLFGLEFIFRLLQNRIVDFLQLQGGLILTYHLGSVVLAR